MHAHRREEQLCTTPVRAVMQSVSSRLSTLIILRLGQPVGIYGTAMERAAMI